MFDLDGEFASGGTDMPCKTVTSFVIPHVKSSVFEIPTFIARLMGEEEGSLILFCSSLIYPNLTISV